MQFLIADPWENETNYFPKYKNFAIRHKATGKYVDVDDEYSGYVHVRPGKCNTFRYFPAKEGASPGYPAQPLYDWSGNWGPLKVLNVGWGDMYITTSARNPQFGSSKEGSVMVIQQVRRKIDQSWEFNLMTKDGCIVGWVGRVRGDPWATSRQVAWRVSDNYVDTAKYEQGSTDCDKFEVVETGCPSI